MEYLNKHLKTLNANKYTLLAISQDGGNTIVSAIFRANGVKWYFHRDELERA